MVMQDHANERFKGKLNPLPIILSPQSQIYQMKVCAFFH